MALATRHLNEFEAAVLFSNRYFRQVHAKTELHYVDSNLFNFVQLHLNLTYIDGIVFFKLNFSTKLAKVYSTFLKALIPARVML